MDGNKAVVWDLDGVLVDSGEAHKASWVAMAREWDIPYDPEKDFPATFGRHNTDIINLLWGVTDANVIQQMADCKEGYFRHSATNLRPAPGAVDLVDALKAAGWKQAIGSSAPLKNITVLLQAMGLTEKMDAIASGDDVSKGKPDPEVFLVAFRKLSIEPAHGVVIEDAPAGVRAGKSAGAACIGIANSQDETVLKEAGADLVVHDLTALSVDTLDSLIGK
ncbi:MAG TPA: HAD family phosphatase [Chloroflexia bacterium]|nr:HAD family phosphatase [Chloroflexia bacterium]